MHADRPPGKVCNGGFQEANEIFGGITSGHITGMNFKICPLNRKVLFAAMMLSMKLKLNSGERRFRHGA